MNKEYNTQRTKLKITDYGRNVAKMIAYTVAVEDREERNALARTIVNVMAEVNPKMKEQENYQQVLWDHMMIMSDFKLDVDSPYEMPEDNSIEFKPSRLKYKEGKIEYRHYGRTMDHMVRRAMEMTEGEDRDQLVVQIANAMKRFYIVWNQDSVTDETILQQLGELSEGKLTLSEGAKLDSSDYIKQNAAVAVWSDKKKKKKKK